MSLLLDTHVLLWWFAGDPIDADVAARIADPGTLVGVSAATVWEIGVKRAVGKLRFEGSVVDEVERGGFELLSISAVHAEQAGGLPPHHRDPFDRMLVAQAQMERMTVVTRDPAFRPYEVDLMPC